MAAIAPDLVRLEVVSAGLLHEVAAVVEGQEHEVETAWIDIIN
jgi:hypothetical protein